MRSLPLLALALCAALPAQSNQAIGLGRPLPDAKWSNSHKLDVQNLTQNNGCLGVASAVDTNGKRFYYVSARNTSAGGNHFIYKFDENGALAKTINQPIKQGATAPGFSSWGLRDLAWDGKDTVYGGCESGATGNTVYALDVNTDMWVSARDWKHPAGVSTCRALAYDPTGNSGKGSMWTANFSAAVVEFDSNGTQLRTIPANNLVSIGQTASFYGAGYDPVRKSVWFWSQGGSTKGTSAATGIRVVGFELDTANPLAGTGQVVFGDRTIPASGSTYPPGGIAGGAEFYVDNGVPTLLVLTQAGSDTIYKLHGRFNFGASCGGTIGFKGDAPYGGNNAWELTLSGSPTGTGTGFLLLSAIDFTLPANPPLFASGCFSHVNLLGTIVTLGSAPIASGDASLKLPVPTTIGEGGEVVFQWVEVGASNQPPLLLSDGGRAYFYKN